MRTAAAMFAADGYGKVSLGALAAKLNVTKPTLYYYFESKDKILLEIKERAQEQVFEVIAVADKTGQNGLDKLERFIRGFLEMAVSDFGRCILTINVRSLEPGNRQKITARQKAAEDRVVAFFEEGLRDGTIHPQNTKIAYQALTGLISWVAVWYKQGGPVNEAAMADQIVDIFLRGVGARR